jgi:hypothetical protein
MRPRRKGGSPYYTPEFEEHISEGFLQEGTAREYFRSTVAKALDLLDGRC